MEDLGKAMNFGSLFAGIGGFDLGFERAGMRCAWQVEIDDRCNQVLAHHWPGVRRYGDVRDVGRRNLETVDLIAGGFPCQDLSVAGRREGLDGERSGLWFEFLRVIEELEPKWVVVENVTGLLSSWGGDAPPGDLREGERWETQETSDLSIILSGLAERGYMGAYRVLNAEFWGVPQRRRRIFIVGCLGDWAGPAEVLFERESSPWDSAPGREAGAGVAAPLTRGSSATGGVNPPGRRREDDCNLVYQCHGSNVGPMGELRTGNGGLTGGVPFVARSLNSHAGRSQEDNETFVSIPYRIHAAESCAKKEHAKETQYARCLDSTGGFGSAQGGTIIQSVSLCGRDDGIPLVAPTLTAPDPNAPKRDGKRQDGSRTDRIPITVVQSVALRGRDGGATAELGGDNATALRSSQGGGDKPYVAGYFGVRRLMPLEAERLQGFPDGFTAVGGMSDSARYRMLGNAVAVPVAEWLGRRIVSVAVNQDPDGR